MATFIPADGRDRALFLYHPKHLTAKRIDISSMDPEKKEQVKEQIQNLKRDGWTEERFAVLMYHAKFGQKIVTDAKDIPGLKKLGWQDKPCELKPNETPLFHARMGFMLAQSKEELDKCIAQGWQTYPCSGSTVHKDSMQMPSHLYPHCADDHAMAVRDGIDIH